MISYLDLSKDIFFCLYHGIDHPLNHHLGEDSVVFSRHFEGYFRDLFTLNVGKSWNFWLIFLNGQFNLQPVDDGLCGASWLSNWMTGWPFFIFFMFPTNWEMLRDVEIPELWGNMFDFFQAPKKQIQVTKKVPCLWDMVFWGQVGVYFNTYFEESMGGKKVGPYKWGYNPYKIPINGLING